MNSMDNSFIYVVVGLLSFLSYEVYRNLRNSDGKKELQDTIEKLREALEINTREVIKLTERLRSIEEDISDLPRIREKIAKFDV